MKWIGLSCLLLVVAGPALADTDARLCRQLNTFEGRCDHVPDKDGCMELFHYYARTCAQQEPYRSMTPEQRPEWAKGL